VTSLQSAAVLRPDPRPIAADDLAPDCYWRGVCEYPGGTPAQMAIEVGKAVLAASQARPVGPGRARSAPNMLGIGNVQSRGIE
jgi:hypothetical protein